MGSQSHKKIYIKSMICGGIGGLLFLLCFLIMSFVTRTHAFYDFVALVSWPFFHLLWDFSILTFIIGPPLLILYWVVLGMVVSFVLVRLYYLFNNKRTNFSDTSQV